ERMSKSRTLAVTDPKLDPPLEETMHAALSWKGRLDYIVETMREMSVQTDPQEMVRAYTRRVDVLFPSDRRISISRRYASPGEYHVTRYSEWKRDIDPWREHHLLPLHSGGLFAELLASEKPA